MLLTIFTRTESEPTDTPKKVINFGVSQAGSSLERERSHSEEDYRR